MFGFFKKKACPETEKIVTPEQKAVREEFEQHAHKLRNSDALAQ